MKKKHIVLLVILFILAAAVISAVVVYRNIEANLTNEMSEVTIKDVDLAKIPDGTYEGSCKIFPVEAVVKVTVKSGKITEVELVKHVNGQGQAAEILPSKVIEAQSLKVDTVSGATYSSKVILKAMENALESAVK